MTYFSVIIKDFISQNNDDKRKTRIVPFDL